MGGDGYTDYEIVYCNVRSELSRLGLTDAAENSLPAFVDLLPRRTVLDYFVPSY